MSEPTPATGGSDLTSRAAVLWRDAISGHPNEDALRRGVVLGGVLEPAAQAWQHAPAGDAQILAASAVGWRFGFQHGVPAGIERAATAIATDLRQARDRIAARPAGSAALASAARQAGLDPAHPDYDLQLHALADALALSGVDLADHDRQHQRNLTELVRIAADVADSAGMPPVGVDAVALPDRLATDVLVADRAAGSVEPARRLFGVVGLAWQAGMVVGEDVGAVYAVHRIAATAARDPASRFG